MNIKKSISIEEWAALAKQGCITQVTTLLNGDSMRPLIRRNTDPVTISPVTRELKTGDVVLFTDGKRYVVHRIYTIDREKEIVQTWGDGCLYPDAPIPMENVLGIAVKFVRNGKEHILDSDRARRWGIRWMKDTNRRSLYFQHRRAVGKAIRVMQKLKTRGDQS